MVALLPQKLVFIFFLLGIFLGYGQAVQPDSGNINIRNIFDQRYPRASDPPVLRGGITLIANSIVNRDTGEGQRPNDPYNITNTSNDNHDFNMRYIDVDADSSTFSSSSAVLDLPLDSCNKIKYVGLYWGAIYRFDEHNSPFSNSGTRQNDLDQVKIKLPGQSTYVDVTRGELIHDGFSDPATVTESPYVYYKDITNLITALSNPEGEYTVANIRASNGRGIDVGMSGGWTMVIIYENLQLSAKKITTNDGFAVIKRNSLPLEIAYSGFETIPFGPVRARVLVAGLEGDNAITGDKLELKGSKASAFVELQDTNNQNTNFFNSTISMDGILQTNRTPNSINNLGWDADILNVTPLNTSNRILPNNETGATFRASTNGDVYNIFLNAFSVEVIEPNIRIDNMVLNSSGNDISGNTINLGEEVEYVITFQNTGNDDAKNFSIKNKLPANVVFDSNSTVTLPPGVTHNYDTAKHQIVFTVPDSLVLKNATRRHTIKFKVKAVRDCSRLRYACSNVVKNTVFSTYTGILGKVKIVNDPTLSAGDICNPITPNATIFLDVATRCNFTETVRLCRGSIDLVATDGFDTYQWRDQNNVLVGTTRQISVDRPGRYTVTKTIPLPCLNFDETVNVVLPGVTQTNPVIPYATDTVVCSNDGDTLPRIIFCNPSESRQIRTGITDATSILWEKMAENSCNTSTAQLCANKSSTCRWNTVGTGANFNVTEEGEYRITARYLGDCFSVFYFKVIILAPTYVVSSSNVQCNGASDGSITINVTDNDEATLNYSIDGGVTFQTAPVFTGLEAGNYSLRIKKGILGENFCDETPQNITITEPDPLQATTTLITPEICEGARDGTTTIAVTGGTSPYRTSINSTEDRDFVESRWLFENLAGGEEHTVYIKDANNCETFVTISIPKGVNLNARAEIIYDCTSQEDTRVVLNLEDDTLGGEVTYAIDPSSPSDMQTENIFEGTRPGRHQIIIQHQNGCRKSIEIDIEDRKPLQIFLEETSPNNVKATASGGVEEYTFFVNGVDNGSKNHYFIQESGIYNIKVVDRYGCEASDKITVGFIGPKPPQSFTPNGDGINDTWKPAEQEAWPKILTKIYDRHGREVARLSFNEGWDGSYNGTVLPSGDYWYLIRLNREKKNDRDFVGHFTLYR